MPDRPRYSRFRRLPGLYRIGEDKPPDPDAEPRLLAIYLPAGLLDRAEAQSMRDGAGSVQEYCTELLRAAIAAAEDRARAEADGARRATFESLDALVNEPDYVAAVADLGRGPDAHAAPTAEGERLTVVISTEPGPESSRRAILGHAGLGENHDPWGLLPTLRRGEPISEDLAERLLLALDDLERSLRGAASLDRPLAYALHRLAFEGQVLVTDGPASAAADPATVERLRRVQEAADRVLSGQDIRYYPGPDPAGGGAAP